jgi:hypothetical protein
MLARAEKFLPIISTFPSGYEENGMPYDYPDTPTNIKLK